jgi:hypothetical protein
VNAATSRRCSAKIGRSRVNLLTNRPSEIESLDVAHADEEKPVFVADFVDGYGVGMLHRGAGSRLPDEPSPQLLMRRQRWLDDLQRDSSTERQLGRAEHDAHSPTPQEVVEPVTADHGSGTQLQVGWKR